MTRNRMTRKFFQTLRVKDNPNFKQYKDTNIYLSKLGEVYKVFDNEDVKVNIIRDSDTVRYFYYQRKKINLPRAIYETFKGTIPKGYVVAHKNKISGDNNINNLYLCTRQECLDRFRGKTCQVRYIQDLTTGRVYKGIRETMKGVGYSKNQIIDICMGRVNNPTIPLRYLEERPYGDE